MSIVYSVILMKSCFRDFSFLFLITDLFFRDDFTRIKYKKTNAERQQKKTHFKTH